MIRTPGGGGPHPLRIIQGLPVMETPCIHARVAPHALFFGANGSSRYIVCHLCREGAGAHLVVAKKGTEGRWRYLAFRLVFTLEGRCLRARVANDDAPLAPPADSREVRLVVGEDGDPALLTDPKDDRRAIHTRERIGGAMAKRASAFLSGLLRAGPPRNFPHGDTKPTRTRPSDWSPRWPSSRCMGSRGLMRGTG